jgi:hypothetical protein
LLFVLLLLLLLLMLLSLLPPLLLPLCCGLAGLRLLLVFGPLRLLLSPRLRPPPLRLVLPRRGWCDVPRWALARWRRYFRCYLLCGRRLVVLFRQALPPLLFRWVSRLLLLLLLLLLVVPPVMFGLLWRISFDPGVPGVLSLRRG